MYDLLATPEARFGYQSLAGTIILVRVKEPISGDTPALVNMREYENDADRVRCWASGFLIGSYMNPTNQIAGVVSHGIIYPDQRIVLERARDNSRVNFAGPAGDVTDFRNL